MSTSTTAAAVYDYFLYRRRVQLLPTTTRERLLPLPSRERLPPLRPVNDYFHFKLVLPENACFEGITRDDRDEMPLHV